MSIGQFLINVLPIVAYFKICNKTLPTVKALYDLRMTVALDMSRLKAKCSKLTPIHPLSVCAWSALVSRLRGSDPGYPTGVSAGLQTGSPASDPLHTRGTPASLLSQLSTYTFRLPTR